jgi:hypothetical protein
MTVSYGMGHVSRRRYEKAKTAVKQDGMVGFRNKNSDG